MCCQHAKFNYNYSPSIYSIQRVLNVLNSMCSEFNMFSKCLIWCVLNVLHWTCSQCTQSNVLLIQCVLIILNKMCSQCTQFTVFSMFSIPYVFIECVFNVFNVLNSICLYWMRFLNILNFGGMCTSFNVFSMHFMQCFTKTHHPQFTQWLK